MRKVFFFLLLQLTVSAGAYSQVGNFSNEFGFRSDNDSYLASGQDRYYTNGLFLNFRRALRSDSTKRMLKKIWEVEAGQTMFNASSGKVRDINEVDRPFAAYLYAGGRLNLFTKSERVLEIGLNVGTIGPNARGQEVQEGLHDVIGFYKIRGWEYQVANEVGINSSFKYSGLIVRSQPENDLSFNTYANLGTSFSSLGAGILFRAGKINDFSRSVSFNSRISNALRDTIPKTEFFLFTRPVFNFVLYDATVQGGLFTNSKGPVTFEPNRFQYSQEFGFNYSARRWTLNFFLTFKSRDVKTQDKAHQFGSALIYYRF